MQASYKLILEIFNRTIPPKTKVSILDYGCGDGALLKIISKKRILKYHGLDINPFSISSAQKKFIRQKNVKFSLIKNKKRFSLGKANSYDVIFAIGVLQYMQDDEINHFISEAAKVLKKNGSLIISCAADHKIYKILDLYNLILPHRLINRKKLAKQLKICGFEQVYEQEKGLIISPFFSHILVIFFDLLDKILFRTKGTLGPIGKSTRILVSPVTKLEYKLPIDYGYTLFISSNKK